MTTVEEIISRIEEFAPRYLAEDWDPIGLSIGSKNQKVNKMMIALDLDANTLKEAKEKKIDFIFTHHPAIFSSLKTLNEEDNRREEYIQLIRSGISLYSAHTNIDAADNGMNDWLAEAIGLEKPYHLMDFSYEDSFKMLTLYLSEEEREKTIGKIDEMTAGELREYNPRLYNVGEVKPDSRAELWNLAEDEKTEMIVPNDLIDDVIANLYKIYSDKVPDFYLTPIEKQGKSYGIGRVGSLKEGLSINAVIEKVKVAYSIPDLRVANVDLNKKVQKIAILGGSGEKYYKQAQAEGAELYITGDISYHGAQDIIREGLAFIDAGHFIENIFVKEMTELLKKWNQEENWDIEIVPSTRQKDVFKFK